MWVVSKPDITPPPLVAWHNGPWERKGKVEREGLGKEEEERHRVVRGRWATRPMQGKGPREGQRMAIGQ